MLLWRSKESDVSRLHNELGIHNHLSRVTSDHPGRIHTAASLLLRYFWIDGPDGRHLALAPQVLGPSISRLNHWQIRLHTPLPQNIALQVTQGLEYLHSEGICHGDFTSSKVLFQLSNFDSWSEYSWAHRGFRLSFFVAKPGLGDQRISPLSTTANLSCQISSFPWTPHYQPLQCSRSLIWVGREFPFRCMGTRLPHIWDACWLSPFCSRYKKHASWSCGGNYCATWKDPFILEQCSI